MSSPQDPARAPFRGRPGRLFRLGLLSVAGALVPSPASAQGVELEVVGGGQPLYPYLISVE